MAKLIHKTLRRNYESIRDTGFKIRQDEYGRFGYGIYFMLNDEFGDYGDGLSVICEVNDKYIYEIPEDKIRLLYPDVYYYEDGAPDIQEYVRQLGYKGIAIPYSNGDIEIVIYDTSIIEIKDFLFR